MVSGAVVRIRVLCQWSRCGSLLPPPPAEPYGEVEAGAILGHSVVPDWFGIIVILHWTAGLHQQEFWPVCCSKACRQWSPERSLCMWMRFIIES